MPTVGGVPIAMGWCGLPGADCRSMLHRNAANLLIIDESVLFNIMVIIRTHNVIMHLWRLSRSAVQQRRTLCGAMRICRSTLIAHRIDLRIVPITLPLDAVSSASTARLRVAANGIRVDTLWVFLRPPGLS